MINILYCGNDKVFDGVLTSALSALKRHEGEESFAFYIFTMDVSYINEKYKPISDRQIEFLDKVVKEYGKDNKVIKISVDEHYKR